MITGDDTPALPGYEIKRREREQKVGSELNRGGGLMIGVKDNIPISEIKNNLRGDQDKITDDRNPNGEQEQHQDNQHVHTTD